MTRSSISSSFLKVQHTRTIYKMTNKNGSYKANFWLFLREKALSFHENSKCTQVSEKAKNVEKITNLIKDRMLHEKL